jgi:hypothetical protein
MKNALPITSCSVVHITGRTMLWRWMQPALVCVWNVYKSLMSNAANDPAYANVRKTLEERLTAVLQEQNDPRVTEQPFRGSCTFSGYIGCSLPGTENGEYWLIYDRNIIQIGAITLLILASSVENGL